MMEEYGYSKWIEKASERFGRTVGFWTEKAIKRECNPILYWLLVHTKNKYIIRLAGFEIRHYTSTANDDSVSRRTEIWRHNKFIEEFNYQLNIKQ